MSSIEPYLIVMLPAAALLALWLVLNRWGRKHDPQGGSARDIWSTNGGSGSHRDPEQH